MIMTFTFIAPFPLLSNGALQQQLFNSLERTERAVYN